jgi:hypothetical protein
MSTFFCNSKCHRAYLSAQIRQTVGKLANPVRPGGASSSGAVELEALRTEREALGSDVDSDLESDLSSREAKAKAKMAAVSTPVSSQPMYS